MEETTIPVLTGTVSREIRNYIRAKYPCQEMPHGHLTAIAEQFGVSRQLVHIVKRQLDFEIVPKTKPARQCKNCGQEALRQHTYCASCATVTFICSECGIEKSATRAEFLRRAGEERKVDGLYCSRRCYGKVFGRTHGSGGRPSLPKKSFFCGLCSKESTESGTVYAFRMKQAKAGILYCSRACFYSARKTKED